MISNDLAYADLTILQLYLVPKNSLRRQINIVNELMHKSDSKKTLIFRISSSKVKGKAAKKATWLIFMSAVNSFGLTGGTEGYKAPEVKLAEIGKQVLDAKSTGSGCPENMDVRVFRDLRDIDVLQPISGEKADLFSYAVAIFRRCYDQIPIEGDNMYHMVMAVYTGDFKKAEKELTWKDDLKLVSGILENNTLNLNEYWNVTVFACISTMRFYTSSILDRNSAHIDINLNSFDQQIPFTT
jgi:hypothetical protein